VTVLLSLVLAAAATGMSDTIKTRHSSRLMMRFFMFFPPNFVVLYSKSTKSNYTEQSRTWQAALSAVPLKNRRQIQKHPAA